MRILSFQQYWPKLHDNRFTTFRFPRKDKDWQQGEQVKIVLKARARDYHALGIAKISQILPGYVFPQDKEYCSFPCHPIMHPDALVDGFSCLRDMYYYFVDRYGKRLLKEPLNKLVLVWVERY